MNKRKTQPTSKQEAAVIPMPDDARQGATFSPDEFEALKHFYKQAIRLWDDTRWIMLSLRASVGAMDDCEEFQEHKPRIPYGNQEMSGHFHYISVQEGISSTLQINVEFLAEAIERIDLAELKLHGRMQDLFREPARDVTDPEKTAA